MTSRPWHAAGSDKLKKGVYPLPQEPSSEQEPASSYQKLAQDDKSMRVSPHNTTFEKLPF